MPDTLILGYGNFDRQDDGVAWHILFRLSQKLGYETPEDPDEPFIEGKDPELLFVLQLTPEMSDILSNYRRVCFVDAHTGNIADDLQLVEIVPNFQNSPFTHHMTPETLLSFTKTIYNKAPEAILVSVRGYEFGFSQELSDRTLILADQGVDRIYEWLSR